MCRINKEKYDDLKDFFLLWFTQTISQLGTSLTSLALTLWLYEKTGSALKTATLTISTFVPYVIISMFAGALTDRLDKKKTMLVCDLMAAVATIAIYVLYKTNQLQIIHLYIINVFTGIMNTLQSPVSEVANTLIVDKKYYQLTGSLNYLSRSAVTVIGPILSSTLYGLVKLDGIIMVDLATFVIGFLVLLFFIKIPEVAVDKSESFIKQTKEGFTFLKEHRMVLDILLFMSGVNLVASVFDAALPGYIIPNPRGGNVMLGIVNSCAGIAMIVGSVVASILPKPKNRVRVVYLTMLFSLGTENFILPLSRKPIVWCIAQFIGWSIVPIMNASLNIIMRTEVPVELQGRIYACRNSLQFFTIPIGMFLGGLLVDDVFEPLMSSTSSKWMINLFGDSKGAGAGLLIFIMGFVGIAMCLFYGRKLKKYHYVEK